MTLLRMLKGYRSGGKEEDVDEKWVQCRDLQTNEMYYHNIATNEMVDRLPEPVRARVSMSIKSQSSDVPPIQKSMTMLHKFVYDMNELIEMQRVTKLKPKSTSRDCLAVETCDAIQQCIQTLTAIIDVEEDRINNDDRSIESILEQVTYASQLNGKEADFFRQQCSSFVSTMGIPESPKFPRWFSSIPILDTCHESALQCGLLFNGDGGRTSMVIQVNMNWSADQLFQNCCTISPRIDDSCILKAKGLEEYFHGEEPLVSYRYFRHCMNRNEVPEICAVTRDGVYCTAEHLHTKGDELRREYRNKLSSEWDAERASLEWYASESVDSTQFAERGLIPITEIASKPFQFSIASSNLEIPCKLQNVSPDILSDAATVSCVFLLAHGTTLLTEDVVETNQCAISTTPSWTAALEPRVTGSVLTYGHIPVNTRLVSVVMVYTKDGCRVPVAWAETQLVDSYSEFVSGEHHAHLNLLPKCTTNQWEKRHKKPESSPSSVDIPSFQEWDFVLRRNGDAILRSEEEQCLPPADPHGYGSITIAFPKQEGKVIYLPQMRTTDRDRSMTVTKTPWDRLPEDLTSMVSTLQDTLLLRSLTEAEKEAFWICRHHIKKSPRALAKLLQSVDYSNFTHCNELEQLIADWTLSSDSLVPLELLGPEYAHPTVRQFAINQIQSWSNEKVEHCLVQLVQALVHEPRSWGPLSSLLLERALKEPIRLGTSLFWLLRVEITRPLSGEAAALLLEALLSHAGAHAAMYMEQMEIMERLQGIAEMVISLTRGNTDDIEVMSLYHEQLQRLNEQFIKRIGVWRNPLSPTSILSTLDVPLCHYMSSKMAPLLLVADPIDAFATQSKLILKVGDDLRQDMLVMQAFRQFDHLWRSNGIELRLSPYSCLPTGFSVTGKGVGVIEVIQDAETTSKIHWDFGGRLGALQSQTISKFIKAHNGDSELVVDNFMRSCAGYCVATYVLGIGDRHNGNIMVQTNGKMFHIDFGHFLGNFKKKFNINRERAAFVYTPEMDFIISGSQRKTKKAKFAAFQVLCTAAFQVLRENENEIGVMLRLMETAGLKQLPRAEAVKYVSSILMQDKSDKVAADTFKIELHKSLNTKWRLFDNLVHTWVHEV